MAYAEGIKIMVKTPAEFWEAAHNADTHLWEYRKMPSLSESGIPTAKIFYYYGWWECAWCGARAGVLRPCTYPHPCESNTSKMHGALK